MSLALAVLLLATAGRFDAVFDATDRVAVVELDLVPDPGGKFSTHVPRVVYESSAASDVDALRAALAGTPQEGVCACIATTETHLYRGDERLATVHYLGAIVKGEPWNGDALLVSHEALLRWFDARGMDGPRDVERERVERDEADRRMEARWLAAMPPVLRPLRDAQRERIRQDPAFEPSGAWRRVLEGAYPDPVERAAALLRWFGYGGPWTGYPSEEAIADALLQEVPFPIVLVAVEQNASEGAVLEGATRLVSDYDFGDARAAVPAYLRRLLLEHVVEGGDADKRARAERALGDRR